MHSNLRFMHHVAPLEPRGSTSLSIKLPNPNLEAENSQASEEGSGVSGRSTPGDEYVVSTSIQGLVSCLPHLQPPYVREKYANSLSQPSLKKLKDALYHPKWGPNVSALFQTRSFLHAFCIRKEEVQWGSSDPAAPGRWNAVLKALRNLGGYTSGLTQSPSGILPQSSSGTSKSRRVLLLNCASDPKTWFELVDMTLWHTRMHPLLSMPMRPMRRSYPPESLKPENLASLYAVFLSKILTESSPSIGTFLSTAVVPNLHARLVLAIRPEFSDDEVAERAEEEEWLSFLRSHFGWNVSVVHDPCAVVSVVDTELENWMLYSVGPSLANAKHGNLLHSTAFAMVMDDISHLFQAARKRCRIPPNLPHPEFVADLLDGINGQAQCWSRWNGGLDVEWCFCEDIANGAPLLSKRAP